MTASWPFLGCIPQQCTLRREAHLGRDLNRADQSIHWCDDLQKKLAETPVESSEDFRFHWVVVPKITSWFTTHVGDIQHVTWQTARLRRAWVAIRRQGELQDAKKS